MKQLTQYLSIAIMLAIIMSISALMTTYINNVYESALNIKVESLKSSLYINKLVLNKNKIIIIGFSKEAMIYEISVIDPMANHSFSLLNHIGNGTGSTIHNNVSIFYQDITNYKHWILGLRNSLIIICLPRSLYLKIYSMEGVFVG